MIEWGKEPGLKRALVSLKVAQLAIESGKSFAAEAMIRRSLAYIKEYNDTMVGERGE